LLSVAVLACRIIVEVKAQVPDSSMWYLYCCFTQCICACLEHPWMLQVQHRWHYLCSIIVNVVHPIPFYFRLEWPWRQWQVQSVLQVLQCQQHLEGLR
jgi:hypothetical protein